MEEEVQLKEGVQLEEEEVELEEEVEAEEEKEKEEERRDTPALLDHTTIPGNHLRSSSIRKMARLVAMAKARMMKTAMTVLGSRASAPSPRQPTGGLAFHLVHRRPICPDSFIFFR